MKIVRESQRLALTSTLSGGKGGAPNAADLRHFESGRVRGSHSLPRTRRRGIDRVRLGCGNGPMWSDLWQQAISSIPKTLGLSFLNSFWPTVSTNATSLRGGEHYSSPIARAQWERDASTIRAGHGKRKAMHATRDGNSHLNYDDLLDRKESSLPGDLSCVCRPYTRPRFFWLRHDTMN